MHISFLQTREPIEMSKYDLIPYRSITRIAGSWQNFHLSLWKVAPIPFVISMLSNKEVSVLYHQTGTRNVD